LKISSRQTSDINNVYNHNNNIKDIWTYTKI
jgi:hypothetical protein